MENFIVCNKYNSLMVDGYADGSVVLSASPCKLMGVIAENVSGSTRWLQVHDGYELPANNAIPIVSFKMLTVTQTERYFDAIKGLDLSVGCVLAVSSTGPKLTVVTGSDTEGCFISAFWR
ncbi:MAG: hypothetical protein WAZ75_01835 [Candidatus Absconditicoccaceae bacterium]